MADDGRFVITWSSSGQDGSSYGVYARRYQVDGTSAGSEFQVNTYTNHSQYHPSVAIGDDGRFVIVWSSYGQDGSSYGVYGQRFQADGTPEGTEFQIFDDLLRNNRINDCDIIMYEDHRARHPGMFDLEWTRDVEARLHAEFKGKLEKVDF
jgi:hypothetical protein